MLSKAHTAFSSFPTGARGFLTADTYTPLTLHGCQVTVEVKGYSARVQLALEFTNETNQDQRVVAAYPLPFGWNIQQCEVKYDGQTIRTRPEKSAVTGSSEAASMLSATGAIADRSVWTVATQSVPWAVSVGMPALMTAVYQVPLPNTTQDGEFVFVLPTELFPDVQRPHAVNAQYNAFFSVRNKMYLPSGLSIQLRAELCVPIRGGMQLAIGCDGNEVIAGEAEGSSYKADCAGDNIATVVYTAPLTATTRTRHIFSCPVMETEEPLRIFVETDMGNVVPDSCKHAIAVGLCPRLSKLDVNAEIVFLCDSHSYDSNRAISEAIAAACRALPPSVLVNFVLTRDCGAGDDGGTPHMCVDKQRSQPITPALISQVCAFIAENPPQRPRTGTSSVPSTLRSVLSQIGPCGCGSIPAGYVRNIVVLTDEGADVRSVSAMIHEAASATREARVSAVALAHARLEDCEASAVDVAQLELLAREGRGAFAAAYTTEETAGALVSVLAQVAVPTLTQVRIRFQESEVRPALLTYSTVASTLGLAVRPSQDAVKSSIEVSSNAPVIPQGSQLFAYALAPSSITGSLSVHVTGKVGKTVLEYVGAVDVDKIPSSQQCAQQAAGDSIKTAGILHCTAAAARVRHLLEEGPHGGATEEDIREVTLLASLFSLLTPHTQLVQYRVVGEGSSSSSSAAVQQHPPVQSPPLAVAAKYVPSSWLYKNEMEMRRAQLLATDAFRKFAIASSHVLPVGAAVKGTSATTGEYFHSVVESVLGDVLAEPSPNRLVPLQRPDGSFTLCSRLGVCLDLKMDVVESSIPANCNSADVWATLIALVAMQDAESTVTQLAEKQAQNFLTTTLPKGEWKAWAADASKLMRLS